MNTTHPTPADLLLPTSSHSMGCVDARLYLCTDARATQGDFADFCAAAFDGGVDVIQLRDKSLEAREELAALEVLAKVADARGKLWAVNDRADIAALSGAPVLHLGQGDLPHHQARHLVKSAILGASTHSEGEALAALNNPDVGYFAVGPCYPTPTKPGRPAPGLDLISYVAGLGTKKPWFAIGGIDIKTIDEVLAAGAGRVVVVRAICEAENPYQAAQALRAKL